MLRQAADLTADAVSADMTEPHLWLDQHATDRLIAPTVALSEDVKCRYDLLDTSLVNDADEHMLTSMHRCYASR